jgi:hypothetical protein
MAMPRAEGLKERVFPAKTKTSVSVSMFSSVTELAAFVISVDGCFKSAMEGRRPQVGLTERSFFVKTVN